MKILLGVDDSPHSDAAVEFVKKMQWPKGTRVLVVAAARPPLAAYSEAYVPVVSYSEPMLEQELRHSEEVAARAEKGLRDTGFATEARVLTGDPRELLIAEARESGADLIVVGSHGRTGLSKLLLGSVASHVVTHAPCSVMVVKLSEAKAAKRQG